MTTLDISKTGLLRLILSGTHENAILNTFRHWPHWLDVEIERDPADRTRCLSVTLIADRDQEPIVREILRRSFGMIFPPEGGSRAIPEVVTPPPTRRAPPRFGRNA